MLFLDSRRFGGHKSFRKPDFSEISFNPITTVHLNYESLNSKILAFKLNDFQRYLWFARDLSARISILYPRPASGFRLQISRVKTGNIPSKLQITILSDIRPPQNSTFSHFRKNDENHKLELKMKNNGKNLVELEKLECKIEW